MHERYLSRKESIRDSFLIVLSSAAIAVIDQLILEPKGIIKPLADTSAIVAFLGVVKLKGLLESPKNNR